MITSTIGKIFLEAYNKKFCTNYDAKSFFVEVYYPLFFDDNKYLQWVTNSPFVQMKKGQKVETLSKEERKEKLQDFLLKAEKAKSLDASIAPGYPASEEKAFATTSGQVTNIQLQAETDDIYYSWFGSSLGIGLQGGISILFAEPEILLDLFDGWKIYRDALSNTPKLKGNQVNTWNGQWLAHRYDKDGYFADQPMANFNPYESKKGDEGMNVRVQIWIKVLIGIARHFQNPRIMGYVYSLGQTNTTIGFIPFNLEHIKRPLQLYQQIFGTDEGKKADELWGTETGLRVCCQKGAIGIEAMQPKGLKPYMNGDKNNDIKLPKYAEDNEEQKISFHTYQIWLLAMLNNQELWDMSLEFAKALNAYARSGVKGKTTNSRQIDEVLKATNKRSFIEALGNIASDISDIDNIQKVALVVNNMPTDNVPYFLTLVRFHVSSLNNKKSTN